MPPKKKKSSSSWSSGRAPAWISERSSSRGGSASKSKKAASRTRARTSAAAKRSSSSSRAAVKVKVKKTATAKRKPSARSASSKSRKAAATSRATTRGAVRTSSRAIYREPPTARTTNEIQRALLDVDEPVETQSFGGAIVTESEQVAIAGAEPSVAEPSVAIAGVTPASLGPEPGSPEEPQVHEAELVNRAEDVPILLAGAVLAASVFLPWYRSSGGITVSGWSTGTWAPLIFFVGAAAVALVVLRRMRIAVTLPFPESVVLEGMGWLATLTAILKARFRPGIGFAGTTQPMQTIAWVYVAVGAGIALALLAGRVSGKTPFVPIPGWFRSRAGKLGAALLLVVIAGSAAFGFVNKVDLGASGTPGGKSTVAPQVVKGLPACAKDFPVPTDFKPFNGIESKNALKTCVATYQTSKTAADAANSLAQAFQRGGWTFTRGAAAQASTFQITKPKCGSATVIPSANKQVYAVINVSNCTAK